MIENFKNTFERDMKTLTETFLGCPWQDKNTYGNWISQTYYFVTYSTRLLSLCASRFDVAENKFHRRYLAHLKEETGHEKLATNDLKALGLSLERFPELPETSALYQSQYFWIEQKDPISFFGYIFALEGLAVRAGEKMHAKIKEYHPKGADSFVRVHSAEDQTHLIEAFEAISGLTPEQYQLIEKNYQLSCNLYTRMLRAITEGQAHRAAA